MTQPVTGSAQAGGAPSCILIGSESLLVQCGDVLRTQGWTIQGVFTDSAAVRDWATAQGLQTWDPAALDTATASLTFDWLFGITYLRIVPTAVLARARKGAVNFHDGPLPRYGGLNAPLWALTDGETDFAITWHRMAQDVDAGEPLVQQPFTLDEAETALSVNARCWAAALESFPQLLDRLVSGAPAQPAAPIDVATYHKGADRPAGVGLLDPAATSAEWLRIHRVADTGRYPNLFLVPWLWTGRTALVPARATSMPLSDVQRSLRPGTLIAAGSDYVTVRVADGVVRLDGIRAVDGAALDVASVMTADGLAIGAALPAIDPAWRAAHDRAVRPAVVKERAWVVRLASIDPLPAPGATSTTASAPATITGTLDSAPSRERVTALLSLFLTRHALRTTSDIGLATAPLVEGASASPLLSPVVPLRVETGVEGVGDAIDAQVARRTTLAADGAFLSTIFARYPRLASHGATAHRFPVCIADGVAPTAVAAALVVSVSDDGRSITWHAPRGGLSTAELERLHRRLQTFVRAAVADPARPVAALPLVDETERQQLEVWGRGDAITFDEHDTIDAQFARQAALTPERVAVTAGGVTYTYAELLQRVDALAAQLVASGVRPDSRVALLSTRTADLVVGMLGIHRAGGAYVPLDPAYPADRVQYMLEDCGATVVVSQRDLADRVPTRTGADAYAVVLLDDAPAQAAAPVPPAGAAPGSPAIGARLAYVIYTSGSTGKPKGVMVEHRQVVNFFRGMDDALGSTPGVWLAVTSISFDISVLELLWTLTRGYTVVVAGVSGPTGAVARRTGRPVGFSLFYFSADEQEQAQDKYRLLMEGARFADANGFEAVWTPERHFHAFGGLYPNPSVTSAAVAAITSRVSIRAGSCVLPLHHPARVAEEWSVVDNISGGRVGISFAAGWQPNDFVFQPQNYADAKNTMFRDIAQVQRLWRGETLAFTGPKGPVEVRTLPRPIQQELPIWITTAGNPETFAQAGTFGGNVLTHLLGQTVEELAPKIAAYRAAWREAGHPGEGRVTLMLHTFVGADDEQVRSIVREPMKAYLRTSVGLIKQYAGVFPTLRKRPGSDGSDIDFTSLTPEEMDALLEFSFERYFSTSALFGSVETAAAMVDKVRGIGVTEVACLVDFGLDTSTVLSHLPHLNALREHCTADVAAPVAVSAAAQAAARSDEESLSALVARHAVTHFQCTPSMARLLLAADDTRDALRNLSVMCVGGEALPQALATELHEVLGGRLYNMYGPTETTIWSSVQPVPKTGEVHLGRPIANTTLQVVDPETRALLPQGTPGELLIGGAGVVRGYLNRPELTAERFIETPDVRGQTARLYRTGDLVQWTSEGALQFLGRIDHQVKIRGYRIELGEIEAAIAGDESVQEVVVVAREEAVGDPRLVAYVTARPGTTIVTDALRTRLKGSLPEFMLPSQYVVLADMPRTPNLKIDRKALPAPTTSVSAPAPAAPAAPATGADADLERVIAGVWCEVLRVASVGRQDNFFDIGGHSLLVVQVHQRLTKSLEVSFPITDLFRFPTVQAIAAHLSQRRAAAAQPAATPGAATRDDIGRRAELRRAAAQRHVRPRT